MACTLAGIDKSAQDKNRYKRGEGGKATQQQYQLTRVVHGWLKQGSYKAVTKSSLRICAMHGERKRVRVVQRSATLRTRVAGKGRAHARRARYLVCMSTVPQSLY